MALPHRARESRIHSIFSDLCSLHIHRRLGALRRQGTGTRDGRGHARRYDLGFRSHSGWCPALVAPCPTCRSEAPIDAALVMVRALPATSVREMRRCSRNDAGAISNQGASTGNLRLVLRAAPCSAQQPCGGQHPTECPVQNMSGCPSNALGFSPRRISCDPFQRNFQIWGGYEGCFGATLTRGENC